MIVILVPKPHGSPFIYLSLGKAPYAISYFGAKQLTPRDGPVRQKRFKQNRSVMEWCE